MYIYVTFIWNLTSSPKQPVVWNKVGSITLNHQQYCDVCYFYLKPNDIMSYVISSPNLKMPIKAINNRQIKMF